MEASTINQTTFTATKIVETNNNIETKKCQRCGETKPITEFYRRKLSADGHQHWCKECQDAATSAAKKAKSTPPPHYHQS